ncbi:MAG: FHA domain-containing protein [Anaerolineaceae bacterium]|nr:FHA domain-containing protein [Anaerolineaceae bacterium]
MKSYFNNLKNKSWLLSLFFLLSLLSFNTFPIQAQEMDEDGDDGDGETPSLVSSGNAAIVVDNPTTESFPQIRFQMKAYDQNGRFITTVFPSAVEIVENEITIIANEVILNEPGLQFTVALNPSVVFLNTYLGYTNWDRIAFAIQTWAESISPGKADTFNFISGEYYSQTHYTSPRSYGSLFEEYVPNFMTELPSLYSLSSALELAGETTDNANSNRSILWITPSLNYTLLQLLPPIIDQAETLGVQVNVWLVGTTYVAESESAPLIKELAERTGGNFSIYTGLEFVPDIEEYVQPLRYYYDIGYYSQVSQPGDHEFIVNLYYDELELHSGMQEFNIQLYPPNPILISPPTLIEQEWIVPVDAIEPKLQPEYAHFNVLVEFPDGIQRPITTSRLYIDGEMVQENTRAPFDHFEWYIGDMTKNQTFIVQAEVTDTLGYTSQTIEMPLQITVGEKPISFFSNTRLVSGIAIGAATLSLLFVILFAGRRRNKLAEQREAARVRQDPLTQPIPERHDLMPRTSTARTEAATSNSFSEQFEENSPARLVYISNPVLPEKQKVILLSDAEVIIGSDERYVTHILDHPSISAKHARIFRNEKGDLIIADCDSLAGTWLNYSPVSERGSHLHDGDLVQLGQEVFRFEQTTYTRIIHPATD